MYLENKTLHAQQELASYCRTGNQPTIQGTNPNRLKHYRRLVYNIFNNALTQAFPITHTVLKAQEWEELLDQFMNQHDVHDPRIWQMPKEFCEFIAINKKGEKIKKPWLNDLLLFEWTEIEVHTMPDEEQQTYTKTGSLWEDELVINPEYRLLQLSYPVHMSSIQDVEQKKGNYFLIIYREPENGNVKFIHLSPLFIHVFINLAEHNNMLKETLRNSLLSFKIEKNHDRIKSHTAMVFNDLIKQRLILGYNQNTK